MYAGRLPKFFFTEMAHVAIKNIALEKIKNYNTTGYRAIINNLVSLNFVRNAVNAPWKK
jgi:hypothetical protein